MQTMGLDKLGVFVAMLSLVACVPQPRERSRVSKERSAAVGAPLISADFGLGAPLLVPNREAPFEWVSPGPGGYLLLAELSSDLSYHELRATVVLSNGESTSPTGRVLAEVMVQQNTAGPVQAVRAGDHWLVVYAGLAIPVSDSGAPGATVALPELGGVLAGLSFDGDRALVVTTVGRGIFLDPSGQPLGDPFVLFPPDRWPVGVSNSVAGAAFDGTHHLVVAGSFEPATVSVASIASTGPTGKVTTLFNQTKAGAYVDRGRLVGGASGALALYVGSPPSCQFPGGPCLPPVSYYRTLASETDGTVVAGVEHQQEVDPWPLDAVFVAGNYLLHSGFNVRWLDPSGMPTGTPGPFMAAASQMLNDASPGSGVRLAPAEDGSAFLAVAGTAVCRLTSNFEVLDDPPVTPLVLPAPQSTPLATFRGDHYLALWNDSGRGGLHATRVERGGVTVDSAPIPVALGDVRGPFAASAGPSSFVGWLGPNTIGAASVSGAGAVTPVDLSPLASPYVSSASVATDGDGYLLTASVPGVLNDPRSDPPALRAALFSGAGALSSTLDFESLSVRTAVTFDGEHYVVLWGVEDGGTVELRAVRFTPSLGRVDPQPRVLLRYPGDAFDLLPSIASDGEGSMIAWTQGDSTLRVARVNRELEVLDAGGVVVADDLDLACGIALSWDGSAYWLLWQPAPTGDRQVVLVGRRFDARAAPVDAAPFEVTRDMASYNTCFNRAMALSSDGEGELLLTYIQADLVNHAPSARARWLRSEVGGEGGEGGAASGGEGPASGGAGTGGAHVGGTGGTQPGGTGGTGTGGRGGTNANGGRGGTSAGGAGGATAGGGAIGTSGEGGALAGGGGESSAGESGADGGKPPSGPHSSDAGCGCSVPRHAAPSGWATLAAASLLLVHRRRRRPRSDASAFHPGDGE